MDALRRENKNLAGESLFLLLLDIVRFIILQILHIQNIIIYQLSKENVFILHRQLHFGVSGKKYNNERRW